MKIEFSDTLRSMQISLIDATNELERAVAEQKAAQANFSLGLAAALVEHGLGRDAMVRHVHARANHGNQSDKEVVSRVINAYALNNGAPYLRIQLGSAAKAGKLSDQFAGILVSDVLAIETSSVIPYGY